ncbi:glutamate 5-kinase [Kordiimonas sediminis]|uniref:Glutamate 5-kinase n=1 Tax=Kordiimonas sediminis TaxID=1735581 RepID=A0A919AQD9_9PROT|nr:glutamate 5-kinase [Kordiimonas sediminis]GHF20457.1 glutamate 5-kinase [Kordiimonas sediminis]
MTHTTLDCLKNAEIIVLKIGSALLVDPDTGDVRTSWLSALSEDIHRLKAQGKKIILVSSGAIALGKSALNITGRPNRLEYAQAAAAIGQVKLAEAYQKIFEPHGHTVAQILLTLGDLEDRKRYINARNTVMTLVENGIIPVINENDTVATTEIQFGDNDRLAARVAQMACATVLVLLSDIDGIYSEDPRHKPDATFFPVINEITAEVSKMAGPPANTTPGSGGMITKVDAGRIATAAGCNMVIMNGWADKPITRLEQGERNSLFTAQGDPLSIRKSWIRGMMAPKGFLHIDQGAADAIRGGASLLPAGVTSVDGSFDRGDLVAFIGPDKHIVGQGLIAYRDSDSRLLMGHPMKSSLKVLGYMGRSALVHRDDLVTF